VPPDDDSIDDSWDDLVPTTAPTEKKPTHITTKLTQAKNQVDRVTPPTFRTQSPGDFEIDLSDLSNAAPPPRSRQATITDEVLLEDARKRSARLSDLPPKSLSEASLDRAQLLSLANDSPVDGDALDLIDQQSVPTATAPAAPAPPPSNPNDGSDPDRDMRDRFSLGDYSGALVVAESILEERPDDIEALRYAESCRNVLAQMYTARIGPLDRVPFIAVPRDQLKWLSIDHRAGFVLSHVDGISSIEQILDVSGMPALDSLRILYELAQQRVIGFR
jgi:hypothetical protein